MINDYGLEQVQVLSKTRKINAAQMILNKNTPRRQFQSSYYAAFTLDMLVVKTGLPSIVYFFNEKSE